MQSRAGYVTGRIRLIVAGVLCVLLLLSYRVEADQIQAGEMNLSRGRIVNLDRDRVKFRTADGNTHYIPLADVDRITADDNGPGLKDFNAAENYLFNKEPLQAAIRYERALLVARDFWPQIIRVRLLIARDQAGEFKKAAQLYLDIVETLPDVAIAMMPTSEPDSLTPEVRNVLIMMDRQLQKQVAEGPRTALLLYQYSISRNVDSKRADELAIQVADLDYPPDSARTGRKIFELRMDALQRLVEGGHGDRAIGILDRMMNSTERGQLVDVLMFKGELYFRLAEKSGERDDYLRSGWSWMRVAIHYPDHPDAARALLMVAKVHETIGRPEAALRLLDECLAKPDLDPEVQREARELQASLMSKK